MMTFFGFCRMIPSLSMQGAVAIAKLAVTGIRALGLPLAARALP